MTSEKLKNLRRHLIPGIYLPFLVGIWVFPVCIAQLSHLSDPFINDLKDWLLYGAPPAVALSLPAALLGITLGVLELKFHSWGKIGPWRQFAILIGGYALCVAVAFQALYAFAFTRSALIDGSLAMLFIPTLIVYLLLGFALTLLRVFKASLAQRKPLLKR